MNPNVKLFTRFVFQRFKVFIMLFCLELKIKGKYLRTRWLVICYCLKKVPKIRNHSKSTKAELPQVGISFCTQFPSLGIFTNKKVGFRKN